MGGYDGYDMDGYGRYGRRGSPRRGYDMDGRLGGPPRAGEWRGGEYGQLWEVWAQGVPPPGVRHGRSLGRTPSGRGVEGRGVWTAMGGMGAGGPPAGGTTWTVAWEDPLGQGSG